MHIISNKIRDSVVDVLSKHWLSPFMGNSLKETLAQKMSEKSERHALDQDSPSKPFHLQTMAARGG